MLYDPSTNPEKTNNQQKISINYGSLEIQKLRQNKTIYLFGITSDWVQQRFLKSPDFGRIVDFTVICFDTTHPDLESLLFRYAPVQYLDYYSICEYYVDPLVSTSDYYRLLDNIADTLEGRGYKVFKVLKTTRTFAPEFAAKYDIEMFLEHPNFVDSFTEFAPSGYQPLESMPESPFTTAWRVSNE